jgi:hypothetical protein
MCTLFLKCSNSYLLRIDKTLQICTIQNNSSIDTGTRIPAEQQSTTVAFIQANSRPNDVISSKEQDTKEAMKYQEVKFSCSSERLMGWGYKDRITYSVYAQKCTVKESRYFLNIAQEICRFTHPMDYLVLYVFLNLTII